MQQGIHDTPKLLQYHLSKPAKSLFKNNIIKLIQLLDSSQLASQRTCLFLNETLVIYVPFVLDSTFLGLKLIKISVVLRVKYCLE